MAQVVAVVNQAGTLRSTSEAGVCWALEAVTAETASFKMSQTEMTPTGWWFSTTKIRWTLLSTSACKTCWRVDCKPTETTEMNDCACFARMIWSHRPTEVEGERKGCWCSGREKSHFRSEIEKTFQICFGWSGVPIMPTAEISWCCILFITWTREASPAAVITSLRPRFRSFKGYCETTLISGAWFERKRMRSVWETTPSRSAVSWSIRRTWWAWEESNSDAKSKMVLELSSVAGWERMTCSW